jgi:hypothetical protein
MTERPNQYNASRLYVSVDDADEYVVRITNYPSLGA